MGGRPTKGKAMSPCCAIPTVTSGTLSFWWDVYRVPQDVYPGENFGSTMITLKV